MANFEEITSVGKGETLIKAQTPASVAINGAYMRGDHFQAGREWIGPPPPPEQLLEAFRELHKTWVPVPVVEEMVDGHVSGAVGREPAFEMMLARELEEGQEYSDIELAEKDALDSLIGNWWDSRNGLEVIQEWTAKLRWAGRATLRLFVPPDRLQDTGEGFVVPAADVQEALEHIYLEAPDVAAGAVHLDRRSMRDVGLYRYNDVQESGGRKTVKKCLEIVFVEEDAADPATIFRVLEGERVVAEVAMPLGGHSLMYQGTAPLLLTDPVIRNQRAMNMINTMLPLNASYAGFRKQDFVNVKKPEDSDGEEADADTGPGQIGFWYSAPYKAPGTGEIKYFPPVLMTTEPVNSEALRADIQHFDHTIRRACKQLHTVLSGESEASAVARIQARAVFANDLLQTTPVVEGALRWLQPALYCFALYLCGKDGEIEAFLETYKPFAQCKPYTGPLTPEEVRVLIELYKEGLISRQDASILFGVEDIDSHIAHIEAEEGDNLKMQISRAELFEIWARTFDAADAAELAGLPEEQVKLIQKLTSGGDDEETDGDGEDNPAA